MTTTDQDIIRAAATVGRDAAEGKLDPADLDAAVAAECRKLFGTVVGPKDALFAVQLDVARQVLAAGGIPATEVSEWAAVLRRRTREAVQPMEGTEPSGDAHVSTDPVSSASGPHSPGTATPDAQPDAGTEA